MTDLLQAYREALKRSRALKAEHLQAMANCDAAARLESETGQAAVRAHNEYVTARKAWEESQR